MTTSTRDFFANVVEKRAGQTRENLIIRRMVSLITRHNVENQHIVLFLVFIYFTRSMWNRSFAMKGKNQLVISIYLIINDLTFFISFFILFIKYVIILL
jgi:hypothetical protein